jgi:transcriptional regulator with XRE-family HTH domain
MNWKNNKDIKDSFTGLLTPGSDKENIELEASLLMAQFLSGFEAAMDKKKLKKKDMAGMIGTSPSYITQIFRRTKTINLVTIAKIMIALDLQCHVKLSGKKEGQKSKEIKTYTTRKSISRVAEE